MAVAVSSMLNGFSFGSLLAMRQGEPARAAHTESPLRHLAEGFRYAWRNRRVRALL